MTVLATAPRIVLDTNVCLDLLRFGDPRTTTLRAALEGGHVVAVTDDECRDEWLRVLTYPLLRLDETSRDAMVAAFDALVRPLSPAMRRTEAALPRCRDPDDQKFLQLAHASNARWLLSRDRHLLSLAKRCRREGWFEITTPEDWAGSDRSL
ncbi:MAG: putative toxin-antitoxin system toxin component, PIN family [Lysobacter sp.]